MKVAVITGANRGLGFETANQLGKLGFKVYLGSRNLEKAQAAADILSSRGMNIVPIQLDVTKTKDIRNLLDALKANGDSIDVLINNAGVFLESDGPEDQSTSSVFKVDPVIILKSIETNTMGPLKLIQSLLSHLEGDGGARIINISSGMGALNEMGGHWPGYRISKTALNALTRIVSEETKDMNISINSVCPGWVKTDMGGSNAPRSVEEGVETTVWLATCDNPPTGKFLRDKKEIDW